MASNARESPPVTPSGPARLTLFTVDSAVTAEGQFPGPLITGVKGGRFVVLFHFHQCSELRII